MTSSSPLVAILRAHAPAGFVAKEEDPKLERRLVAIHETARSKWLDLPLSAEQFIRHIAKKLPAKGGGRTLEQVLSGLHLDDLYLACACAAGVPGAADTLDREYLARLRGILKHRHRSPETIDEVCQKVREKLLVRAGISSYSGEGKLLSWLEVVAERLANKEDRARGNSPSGRASLSASRVAAVAGNGADLERDVIKKGLMAEVQVAVGAAGSILSPEQREMLRFHYRNGKSEAWLAKFFHTSQPTISRRLSKAKELVLTETMRTLQQRLRLTESEFESLIDEIRSRWLDLSLSQVFGDSEEAGPDSKGSGPDPEGSG